MAVKELICPYCSHRNRVPDGAGTFICWNCKRGFAISSDKGSSSITLIVLICVAGSSIIGSILSNRPNPISTNIAPRNFDLVQPVEPPRPAGPSNFAPWPQTPVAPKPRLPEDIKPATAPAAPRAEVLVPVKASTGFLKRASRSGISPLTIKTGPGANYFVRLVDLSSKKREAEIFIIGGETFSGKMPLGRYRIRYASGSTWYGEKLRFGASTSYSEASETFEFRKDRSHVYGYTIELIMQIGGNLSTHAISAKDFDD